MILIHYSKYVYIDHWDLHILSCNILNQLYNDYRLEHKRHLDTRIYKIYLILNEKKVEF